MIKIAFSLPVLCGMAICVYAWLYFIEFPLCHVGDVYQYYLQISSGDISDWWSALYMFECRAWMKWISAVSGLPENACLGMFVMKVLTIASLAIAIELFLYVISKFNSSAVLPAAVTLSAMQLFLSISTLRVIESVIGRLDVCGASLLLLAISGALVLNFCQKRKCKIFLLVVIAVALLHACMFRKPFMALVPVISLYVSATLYDKRFLSFVNILNGALFCVLFWGAVWGVGKILPAHKHTYPASTMLLSELGIAGVLNGEAGLPDGSLAKAIGKPLVAKKVLDADMQGRLPIETAEDYKALLEAYIGYTMRNPLAMFNARFLQCVEFCTSNHVPVIVRRYIHACHPNIGVGHNACEECTWPVSCRSLPVRCVYYLTVVLWLGGSLLPIIHYCLMYRHADSRYRRYLLRSGIYLGCLCLASLLCYMVVVPSSDFRYRIHVLMISCMSLFWCWVMWRSFASSREKATATFTQEPCGHLSSDQ